MHQVNNAQQSCMIMSYFPVLLEVGILRPSTPQPSSIVGVKSGSGCCVADGVIGGIEPIMGGIRVWSG